MYRLALRVIIIIILLMINLSIDQSGVDWQFVFRPSAVSMLGGLSYLTGGQFLFPWGVWSYLPLVFVSNDIGLAIIRTYIFYQIGATFLQLAQVRTTSVYAAIGFSLSISNLFVFDEWIRGQVDVWITLSGIAMGHYSVRKKNPYLLGLAFLLLSGKPPNGIPTGILFWFWIPSIRKKLIALTVAGIGFVISLVLHPGWIHELWTITVVDEGPIEVYKTTLYRFMDVNDVPPLVVVMLGLAFFAIILSYFKYRGRVTLEESILLVMSTTFFVSPYITTYRTSLLLVIFFVIAFTAKNRWGPLFGTAAWFMTFIPLLRIFLEMGHAGSYLDFLVVVLMFVATHSGVLFESKTQTNRITQVPGD